MLDFNIEFKQNAQPSHLLHFRKTCTHAVGEAWTTAAERAINLFWQFRIQFLSEARSISHLCEMRRSPNKAETYFDSFGDVRFTDTARWSEEPYCRVKRKKQYDNPVDYFNKEDAEKIKQTHSLEASLYWVAIDGERKKRKKFQTRYRTLLAILKWMARCMIYFILLLLGFLSFGFTWPLSLRRNVLAVGLNSKTIDEDKQKE